MYEEKILNQDLGFIRPKYIVMEGLLKKADTELGRLRTDFDFTYEYPRQETIAHDDESGETFPRRRVVIKKLDGRPTLKGINQTYTSETYVYAGEMMEAEGIGQVDKHTIEISVWSPDAKDRDNLIDLIKIWMLELNRNEEETGQPFFYNRGVYAVEEVRNYESIDRGNVTSSFHVGVVVYDVMVPFYGTHTEHFKRYKFDLINSIIDLPSREEVVVDIKKPLPEPVGETPGSGGTAPDQDVIVRDNTTKYASYPGGQTSSPQSKSGETIVIPGPNTEERTAGDLISESEDTT